MRAMVAAVLLAGCATGGRGAAADAWEPDRTWVFMVGILEWEDPSVGTFPQEGRRDQELVDLFKSRGVRGDRIVFLKDAAATKAAIEDSLREFVARPGPGDFLFVYYAGHGTRDESGTTSFLPYDGGGWTVPSIVDAIESGFRGARVLLAADCCYSGGLGAELIRRQSPFAALASSLSSEVSTGNWTFTECLLAGFGGDARTDLDGDGRILLEEVARYAEAEMTFAEGQLTTFVPGNAARMALASAGRKAHPRIGERVEAKWRDEWYRARIVDVRDGEFRVSYVGYGAESDEWVGEERLRPFRPVEYAPSAAVEVEWRGRWYPATVLRVRQGMHLITYEGYSDVWDEWVGASRMRPR